MNTILTRFMLVGTLFLTACNNQETNETKKETKPNLKMETVQENDFETDELEKEKIGERASVFEHTLDMSHRFKNMTLQLEKIQTSTIKLKEEQKEYYDGKDEIAVISIKASVKNTGKEEVSFGGNANFVSEDGSLNLDSSRFTRFSGDAVIMPGATSQGHFVFVMSKEELDGLKGGILSVDAPLTGLEIVDNDYQATIPLNEGYDGKNVPFLDQISKEGLGKKKILYTETDLDLSGKSADVDYKVHAIQVANLNVGDEHLESFDNRKEFISVTMDVEATNHRSEPVNIELGTTHLDVNGYYTLTAATTLSDNTMSGELQPGANVRGYIVFFIHPDDYKDIKNVSLRLKGPMDADFSELGKEVKMKVELK